MTGVAPEAMPSEIDSDSDTSATVVAGARLCRAAATTDIGPSAVCKRNVMLALCRVFFVLR